MSFKSQKAKLAYANGAPFLFLFIESENLAYAHPLSLFHSACISSLFLR